MSAFDFSTTIDPLIFGNGVITVHLATVIDLFNREVIGYAIADHHRASLVCDAVNTARFRKVLGWKTPAEAFNQHLRSNQQIGVATTH